MSKSRCHPKLAPLLAHRLDPSCVSPLRSREAIPTGGGISLRVLYTPGHEDDHLAFYLSEGRVIFSGDTILGNSSSSVRNLKQYMASLELLSRQRPDLICPGHGQVIHNATRRVQWYIEHRQQREAQVVAAIAAGARSVEEVVRAVYPRNLRRNLREAAARNVRTHLAKLREDNRVAEDAAKYTLRDR